MFTGEPVPAQVMEHLQTYTPLRCIEFRNGHRRVRRFSFQNRSTAWRSPNWRGRVYATSGPAGAPRPAGRRGPDAATRNAAGAWSSLPETSTCQPGRSRISTVPDSRWNRFQVDLAKPAHKFVPGHLGQCLEEPDSDLRPHAPRHHQEKVQVQLRTLGASQHTQNLSAFATSFYIHPDIGMVGPLRFAVIATSSSRRSGLSFPSRITRGASRFYTCCSKASGPVVRFRGNPNRSAKPSPSNAQESQSLHSSSSSL